MLHPQSSRQPSFKAGSVTDLPVQESSTPASFLLGILTLLLVVLASAHQPLFAQTPGALPNFDRGFKADRAYEFGNLEQVNLFNGNLSMTIPVGQEYSVSDGLSYQFFLVYNSRLWDWEQRTNTGNPAIAAYNQAHVAQAFNAGLGWQFSLGRLGVPQGEGASTSNLAYTGPDGAEHKFGTKLNTRFSTNANYKYTTDGSYLRLRKQSATIQWVEFPSGEQHKFEKVGSAWRLARMEDHLGSFVNITYPSASQWHIADSTGRSHNIFLTAKTFDGVRFVPTSASLAAFGGTTATYVFQYANSQSVRRPCAHDDPLMSATISAPLLTGLVSPNSQGGNYSFNYHPGTTGSSCIDGGLLDEVTLPTLGKYQYEYTGWNLPVICRPSTSPGQFPFFAPTSTPGVSSRRHLTRNEVQLSKWEYSTQSFAVSPYNCRFGNKTSTPFEYSVTTVKTPLKDQQKHYFSSYRHVGGAPSPNGFQTSEHALASSRHSSISVYGTQKFLSQEIFDCAANGGNCQKVRSIFSRWEYDNTTSNGANRRQQSMLTRYHFDGSRFRVVENSCFDGLGHYRKAITDAGGGSWENGFQTEQKQYNPNRGGYNVDANGKYTTGGARCGTGQFTMWPTSANWVLETLSFAQNSLSSGRGSGRTDFSFNASTGFLTQSRVRKSVGTTGVNDLRTTFARSPASGSPFQVTERNYGGDIGNANGSVPVFTKIHKYRYGTKEEEYFSGFPKGLDLTIDQNTGLPSRSTAADLLYTDYTYDLIGRVTAIKQQQGTWVRYDHINATGSGNAFVRTHYLNNGSLGGVDLAKTVTEFDDLGRLLEDQRLLPSGALSKRNHGYDADSNKAFVSSWGNLGQRTNFLDYDPFGRPRKITPPQGTAFQTVLEYTGDRRVKEKRLVGTAQSGGNVSMSVVSKQLVYDKQGLLAKAREQSSPTSTSNVDTLYDYDFGGRLTKAATSFGGVAQNRFFFYDLRGFLTAETSPESGTTSFSNFDPLGNARRRTQANGVVLDFSFDNAARPTTVNEFTAGNRLLKQWTYGTSNSGTNRRRGKVTTASRYNFVLVGTFTFQVRVKEDYEYRGVGGRVSSRQTEVLDVPASGLFRRSKTLFAYNDLGNPSSITYPACFAGACSAAQASPKTVSYGYSRGYPTSIAGYAGFSYHSNQTLASIGFGNGVTQTFDLDPRSEQRPRRIRTSNVSGGLNWDTGNYQFDGAGNITKIGAGWFVYDKAQRLKQAKIYLNRLGAGTARTQTYSYDIFGNLSGVSGNQGINIPTNSATNRLTVAGTSYDNSGNLLALPGKSWEYGPFNQPYRYSTSSADNYFLYSADNERVYVFNGGDSESHYVRDLENRVVRVLKKDFITNQWSVEDKIHGPAGKVVASDLRSPSPSAPVRSYFHTDHLGTIRQVTDANRNEVAYHVYYPFGREATTFNQSTERLQFTGHERDLGSLASSNDDMDYMRARYMYPLYGKFLSVDPARGSAKLEDPQSWNRYAYVVNNPQKFVDPDGENPLAATVLGSPPVIIETVGVAAWRRAPASSL